jgi:hypothetical protein
LAVSIVTVYKKISRAITPAKSFHSNFYIQLTKLMV